MHQLTRRSSPYIQMLKFAARCVLYNAKGDKTPVFNAVGMRTCWICPSQVRISTIGSTLNTDFCCAGGRGGKGVQRGWLCERAFRTPLGSDCPRVRPKDKPHVAWHPSGGSGQGGDKAGPHSGQGQGAETDYWAYLVCTVGTHQSPKLLSNFWCLQIKHRWTHIMSQTPTPLGSESWFAKTDNS